MERDLLQLKITVKKGRVDETDFDIVFKVGDIEKLDIKNRFNLNVIGLNDEGHFDSLTIYKEFPIILTTKKDLVLYKSCYCLMKRLQNFLVRGMFVGSS